MATCSEVPGGTVRIGTTRLLFRARFDAASLDGVRRRVLRHLDLAGLSDARASDFLIAVGEILANAIEHGGGSGVLELRHNRDHLDCEICDEGPGLPPGIHGTHLADPLDERGRGLHLAHLLCDRVLHHQVVTGTRITLRMTLPPVPA